jgi:hypothetical protein
MCEDIVVSSGVLFIQNFIKCSKYCGLAVNQGYHMQVIDRVVLITACFIGESTYIGSVPTLPGSCSTP